MADCDLKFIVVPGQSHPGVLMAGGRFATCTHPDHTWAVLAPGTGTARARVEHGKHIAEVAGRG